MVAQLLSEDLLFCASIRALSPGSKSGVFGSLSRGTRVHCILGSAHLGRSRLRISYGVRRKVGLIMNRYSSIYDTCTAVQHRTSCTVNDGERNIVVSASI